MSAKAMNGWMRLVRWREQRLGLRLLRAVVLASTLLAALAAGVLLVLDYRREIAARGRARAALFSWDDCARKTAAAYRLALASK